MKGKRLVMFLALTGGVQYCSGYQPMEPSLIEFESPHHAALGDSSSGASSENHNSGQKKASQRKGLLNRVKEWFGRDSGASK